MEINKAPLLPTKQADDSKILSNALKAINLVVSVGLLLYFWGADGPNWKDVEFVQIVYLSLLLILVTVPLKMTMWRTIIAACIYAVVVSWLYLLGALWAEALDLDIGFQIAVFVCGLLWATGIISACYVSERANSNGEVDLILYLLTLNAVNAMGSVDTFNIELHLILDVRTFMLVFNCLHNLQKNEDLLRYPAFISVIVLTIITFFLTDVLFANEMQKSKEAGSIITFVLFGVIGVILMVEVYISVKAKQKPSQEETQTPGASDVIRTDQ